MMQDKKFRALIWILAFELTTIWMGGGCRSEKLRPCKPVTLVGCAP